MPHYVDIGMVRIQRYLSRTPTLRGRRGASAALAEATAEAGKWLDGRAEVNTQAGRVDGVLSLVVYREGDRDAVVRDVLGHLRRKLPGAEFQVVWGDGPDYLAAYAAPMADMRESGAALADLPAGAEFPLAALCDICRVDPVVGRVNLGTDDGVRGACDDCVMRHLPETKRLGRTTEDELVDRVGAGTAPRTFDALAELAGAGNKEHLATVHADGNAVGRFFDKLAESGVGAERPTVVKHLTESTFEALAVATCAVRRPDDPALCVVPHVLGGDDVLVSLPADRAWRFTTTFVQDFGQRMARLARELGAGLVPPTMSAGVVFGRRNFPFTLAVEQAEHLLRLAKKEGAGREPWIAFADTVSGSTTDGDPVSLAALKRLDGKLSELARLPRSNQFRLVEALGRGGQVTARTLAARLGHTGVITPFLAEQKPADSDDEGIELAQALRIARWWPR